MGKRTKPRRAPAPGPAASSPSTRSRRFAPVGIGIFALAFTIRLWHFQQISSAPFYGLLMGDGLSYDAWARQLASGDWWGSEVFYQAPLYPYLLGAVYSVAGDAPLAIRLVQAALGSLACVLLAHTGWRLFSPRVGIAAGVMLAATAPAIFSDGIIQKSSLDFFLFGLVLWLLSGLVDRPDRRGAWAATGVALGLLSLTRENALVLVAAILAWTWLQHRPLGRERFAMITLLVLGLAAVLLPVATRNQVVGGDFYVTTSQLGPNLYIGNNPDANGTYRALRFGQGAPEYEREDATSLAEQAVGRTLTPREVSRYWTREALAYITSQPLDWLRLMAVKVLLLWNATETVDTESQYTHAEWSLPLRLTGYISHFGVLVPLAVVGLWATWGRRDRLWLLYLMAALYAASVLAFYVFTRYRYPLVPILILFAAAAIVEGREFLRRQSTRQVVVGLGIAAAAAVFANWPTLSRDNMRSATEDAIATAFREQGRLQEAAVHYRRALELDPRLISAHNNLASLLAGEGRLDEAVQHYSEALRSSPDAAQVHYNLANALSAAGRSDEAITHYRDAIRLDPSDVAAHNNLGIQLYLQGRADEALAAFREALRVDPNAAMTHDNLARVLEEQGQLVEALEHYRRAVALAPDEAGPHNSLAAALRSLGRFDEAIAEFEAALQINPDFVEARANLGATLGAQGRLKEATEHFREVVRLAPGSAEAHNVLGIALSVQGDLEGAIQQFEEAVRLDPGHADAQENLRLTRAQLNRGT